MLLLLNMEAEHRMLQFLHVLLEYLQSAEYQKFMIMLHAVRK